MTNWEEINRNKLMILITVMLFIGTLALAWGVGQYMNALQDAGYIKPLVPPVPNVTMNMSMKMTCLFRFGVC
jgi:hypothetical protein